MPPAWTFSPCPGPPARFCCAPLRKRLPRDSEAQYPAKCTANRRWRNARRFARPSCPRPTQLPFQSGVSSLSFSEQDRLQNQHGGVKPPYHARSARIKIEEDARRQGIERARLAAQRQG